MNIDLTPTINRRSLLKTVGVAGLAMPFIVTNSSNLIAQSNKRIRYNIASPEGAKMLMRMREAIGHMKLKAHHEPRSWRFWANTHWISPKFGQSIGDFLNEKFDPDQGDTQEEKDRIAKHRELAWKNNGERVWMTCEHTTDHFLTWHRMFLHFFELTIQAVLSEELGDTNPEPFAVPYWDFTSNDLEKRKIPIRFREVGNDGNQQSNALWYSDRDSVMNQTNSDVGLSDADVDISSSVSQLELLGGSQGQGFQRHLDVNAHGNVHVAVGAPFTGLSTQEQAGRDPLFWPFHSNDDRLWESWRNPLGQPGKTGRDPTVSTWLNKKFSFATPDGERAELSNEFVLDMANLGFSYDLLHPMPPANPLALAPQKKAFDIGLERQILSETNSKQSGLTISKTIVTTSLTSKATQSSDQAEVRRRRRYLLVLDDVRTQENTGDRYDVYLNFPRLSSDRGLHVGRFNFFSKTKSVEGIHSHHSEGELYFVYDVTDAVDELQPEEDALVNPTISIVPVRGISNSEVNIMRIQLLTR